MQIHTTVFYCLVAVLAILYYAVNKIFNMKADIIVFYYVITAVLVIAYGLYVKFKNAGETKKIKAMFAVCAVVVVADVAAWRGMVKWALICLIMLVRPIT